MSDKMNAAIRLTLEDQFSDGIKDAGENVKDFSEDTEKSTKEVDKELGKAGKSAKQLGESANKAGKKAEGGFRAAGSAVREFADGAKTAASLIDKAYSGAGAALATLGVSLSVGSAAKEVIDLDDKLTRIGLTADASAEQVQSLKDSIFDAALNSEIKVDTSSIADALDVVMTKTGDLAYSEANIKNIATAIKATGESGEAIGSVFAEFQKFGYTAEQISSLMDDMVKQGDQGAFTFGEFAKAGSAVISAYSPIGTAPDDIKRANAAMQIIMMGTKSADIAVTALGSAMSELSNADKQEKLMALGVRVRDNAGKFRDFNDIMADMLSVSEKVGNSDFLTGIFGSSTMQAIHAYENFYEKMYPNLMDLGDTTGAMQSKAATMAGTLSSNLQNLQTAFVRFADLNLTAPLEKLTELLNNLAENKAVYQGIFTGLAVFAGAIGTIKIASGVSSFVQDFMKLKNGDSADISIGSSVGAQGMPVYVTNWGGQGGSAASPTAQAGQGALPAQAGAAAKGGYKGKLAATGAAVKTAATSTGLKAAGAAGVLTALEAVPQAMAEWKIADSDEKLTKKEKNKAKGGALGAATGKIVGAAGGAWAGTVAGAAIGSVVPVVGTAIGGLVGAGIGAVTGYFAGKGGRFLGEKIGEKLTKDDNATESVSDELARNENVSVPEELTQYTSEKEKWKGATATLDGEAVIGVDVKITNETTLAEAQIMRNSITGTKFNTGSLAEARSYQ